MYLNVIQSYVVGSFWIVFHKTNDTTKSFAPPLSWWWVSCIELTYTRGKCLKYRKFSFVFIATNRFLLIFVFFHLLSKFIFYCFFGIFCLSSTVQLGHYQLSLILYLHSNRTSLPCWMKLTTNVHLSTSALKRGNSCILVVRTKI